MRMHVQQRAGDKSVFTNADWHPVTLKYLLNAAQQAFAKRAAERAAAAAAAANSSSGSSLASSSTGRRKISLSDADLASIMGTPNGDEPGIDMTVGGGYPAGPAVVASMTDIACSVYYVPTCLAASAL
jgi:hypothetical protein